MDLDSIQQSVVARWLPLSVALAVLTVMAIGIHVARTDRARYRSRAFALLPVALALIVVATFAPGESYLRLGTLFILFVASFGVYGLVGLWQAVPYVTDRRAALLLAMVVFAVFLAIDPYHRAVQPTQSDEPHYLLISQSLLLDGDLDLANDYSGDRYRSFYDGTFSDDIHGIRVGTRVYSIRDLGLPVVAVPFFAIANRLGVMALVSLVGAALIAQLYLLLRDLEVRPRIALVATGLVGLLHPVLTYAAEIEPELFAALLFVIAVRALRHGRGSSLRALAIASACAGLIGIFTTRGWFLSLGILVALAVFALVPRLDLGRRVAASVAPFGALVLLISYVDCRMFPFPAEAAVQGCYFIPSAGYYLIRDQQAVLGNGPLAGAAGLLFDRVFGLISHAPLYLLAFAGLVPLWRRFRAGHAAEVGVLALGSLLLIAYIANVAYWWADGMPPSRYLVAPLPLLVIAVGLGLESFADRSTRLAVAVVALLAVPSAIVTALYAILPSLGYDLAVDIQHTGYPGMLWAYVEEHWGVDPGLLFPSLVRPDGGTALAVAGWSAIAVAFGVAGWRARPAGPAGAIARSPASSAID